MTITYRDPITCDECGHFVSKHDSECSQWTEPFIPREDLHQYVIATNTKYLVYAPSLERAMLWFTDTADIDLDSEIIDFGTVEFVEEREPAPEDRRYRITDRGRAAIAS